jgi:hypothetical protein
MTAGEDKSRNTTYKLPIGANSEEGGQRTTASPLLLMNPFDLFQATHRTMCKLEKRL